MRRTVRPFLALTLVLGLLAAFEGSASAALASVTPAPMCQSDGSVSSDPAVTAKNRRVQDVLISASTDTVYFGGRFTSLLPPTGGSPSVRNRLGACKLSSGEILPWNPNADGHVYALATDGTTVYAGGSFKNVGGVYHPGLVAINPSSGAVLTWKPKLGGGVVKSLAISGTTLYLGGTFKTVNGEARRALAAVDTKDGSLKDWNPASGFDPAATYDVRALAVSGTKILAGEYYTSNTMPNLMAIDATTASALPWKYAPTRPILDLSVSGSRLYAATAVLLRCDKRLVQVVAQHRWQHPGRVGVGRRRLRRRALRQHQEQRWNAHSARSAAGRWHRQDRSDPGVDQSGQGVYALQGAASTLLIGGEFAYVAGKAHRVIAKFPG